MDVHWDVAIPGLEEPVWMTARTLQLIYEIADCEGFCDFGIEDRRAVDGTVNALVKGAFIEARIDLPVREPLAALDPPQAPSWYATATVDCTALRKAAEAASSTPAGVTVIGPPVATFTVEPGALVITGTDRRGVDRAAEIRLKAEVEFLASPATYAEVSVDPSPLIELGWCFLVDKVTVVLTFDGELWMLAEPCRMVLRGDLLRLEPDELEGIVYLVGSVVGTDEAVLSMEDLPVDGITVWIESRPDDYDLLERVEQLYEIDWYAEPEPYGVILPES